MTGTAHNLNHFTIICYTVTKNINQQNGKYMAVKKKKKKMSGPQGPISRGSYDAKSPKNAGAKSFVLGTKTNKNPAIRGLTPMPKGSKKK